MVSTGAVADGVGIAAVAAGGTMSDASGAGLAGAAVAAGARAESSLKRYPAVALPPARTRAPIQSAPRPFFAFAGAGTGELGAGGIAAETPAGTAIGTEAGAGITAVPVAVFCGSGASGGPEVGVASVGGASDGGAASGGDERIVG